MEKGIDGHVPFFIVGTGRCGTRMLMNVLNEWPDVRGVPETQFITPLYRQFQDEKITAKQFLRVVDNIHGERGEKFVLRILAHANIHIEIMRKGFAIL